MGVEVGARHRPLPRAGRAVAARGARRSTSAIPPRPRPRSSSGAARAVAAIVATDEQTADIGALAAARLGLPFNRGRGDAGRGDKLRAARGGWRAPGSRSRASAWCRSTATRRRGRRAALPGGDQAAPPVDQPRRHARRRRRRAGERVRAAGARCSPTPGCSRAIPRRRDSILIEEFVPGRRSRSRACCAAARCTSLALFDKPDPLDGPFFEETIYVTPSRLPAAMQRRSRRGVARGGARRSGLREGPVHAELRLGPDGPVRDRGGGALDRRAVRARRSASGRARRSRSVIIAHALGRELACARTAEAAGRADDPGPARRRARARSTASRRRARAGRSRGDDHGTPRRGR